MRETDISLCACLVVLVFGLRTGFASGWTPIAPPVDYYAAKTADCAPSCDAGYKVPFLGDSDGGAQGAETQVKSTLLRPSVAFNQEKGFHQSEKKLDLEIFKPTQVPFFPSGEGNAYEEAYRQSPSSFFSFQSYAAPGKPTKTIYYGDLELAKPKLTSDVKYYKPYKQNLKTELKTITPGSSYFDNEVNLYQMTKAGFHGDHCSLYKVSFRQDLYYQYIQYKVHMPELKEFTLCLWMRFHNHSHDHSLFSYGVKPHRQAIYMWVSNLNDPGLFNMKVLGQTIFRLNYPIKLYRWYHTCQSWNGNTGEWQVWVDSHRIARGFHNLLVNHPIPGGGISISGQEHRHFGRGFQEIPQYYKGSGGLQGEVTMVQMYKIALSAGKAYNDHSHHHSHYTTTTAEPPELPTDEPSTTTDHPLLENGQLKKHVNVLEIAEALKKGHLDTPEHTPSFHHFFHKPLSPSFLGHVPPFPVHANAINFVGLPTHAIFKRNDETESESTQTDDHPPQERNEAPERIKYISNVSDHVQVEKIKFPEPEDPAPPQQSDPPHGNANSTAASATEVSAEDRSDGNRTGRRLRRQSVYRVEGNRTKRVTFADPRPSRFFVKKRAKVGGGISRKASGAETLRRQVVFDDSYLGFGHVGLTSHDVQSPFGGVPSTGYSYEYLSPFGQDYGGELPLGSDNSEDPLSNDSDKKKKHEPELAEGEVRRIMELCSGCHVDPFRKVAVISWRSTPKKIYSGTLFLRGRSECGNF